MSKRHAVERHYDALAAGTQDYKRRRESRSIRVRNFNNAVKSALLHDCATRAAPLVRALDLCGGRGGDLYKWSAEGVRHLVVVDASAKSVEEARKRASAMPASKRIAVVRAYAADCFGAPLASTTLAPDDRDFDVVSCQFAAHYAFGERASVDALLANVGALLRHDGGVFTCTVPSYERLARRVAAAAPATSFGNALFSVDYDERTRDHDFSTNALGVAYRFLLVDAVDRLTEYCVPPSVLVAAAHAHELELSEHTSLRNYAAGKATDARLVRSLRALTAEDVEVVDLYDVFVFTRRRRVAESASDQSAPTKGVDAK